MHQGRERDVHALQLQPPGTGEQRVIRDVSWRSLPTGMIVWLQRCHRVDDPHRIIVGICDRITHHKLLKACDLSWAKAMDICKVSEVAGHQLKAMSAADLVQSLHLSKRRSGGRGQGTTNPRITFHVPIWNVDTTDKSDLGNYRPVSLTSVACNIMQSVIKDTLVLSLSGKFSCYQHGFLKSGPCLTNHWRHGLKHWMM